MGFFTLLDPMYWIIVGPAMLLALLAQMWVKSAYNRYSRVANRAGYTGAEAAREMLSREGVSDVSIEITQGWLSDHYDPRSKTLHLSPKVHNGQSVAAVGIAAHEAGHALQHAHGYTPLALRNAIVPTASLGSWLAFPLIIIGLIIKWSMLAQVGVILFAGVVVFQFITLPVELNASSRAKDALVNNGVIGQSDEIDGVNRVLNAAAMTYVAATVTALAQLLYFAMLLSGSRD